MNLDFRSKTRRPRCSTRDFRNRIGKGRNNQLLVRKANLLGKIIATPDIFKLHGGFDHVGDRSHELFAPAEVEMEGDGIGVSCVQLGGHLLRGVPLADCAGIHFGEEFLVVVELNKNVAANAQTSALARLAPRPQNREETANPNGTNRRTFRKKSRRFPCFRDAPKRNGDAWEE
jgi:hypothetical protein